MLKAFNPHPEDKLHLRLHRARSVVLTSDELVEIRAAQRTFEGAYMRTALSQFSFALIILKIFTSEFYAIGALLAVYGFCVLLVAIYRRHEGNRQFFKEEVEELVDCSSPSTSEYDDEEEEAEQGQGRQGRRNVFSIGRLRRRRMPGPGVPGRLRHQRSTIVSKKIFRTSGNSVALLAALSLGAYISLLTLILRLE